MTLFLERAQSKARIEKQAKLPENPIVHKTESLWSTPWATTMVPGSWNAAEFAGIQIADLKNTHS